MLGAHRQATHDTESGTNKEHLLFPGAKGGDFRSMTSLTEPFVRVAKEIGVDFEFTQR